jgi:ADP-ribose pyrophosphatase YjhB (NUDIX family)
MPYTPILATLGYVLTPDRSEVLLIHRNARRDDPAWDKYNGLGGKLEPDEDVAAGMRRELREEAGDRGERDGAARHDQLARLRQRRGRLVRLRVRGEGLERDAARRQPRRHAWNGCRWRGCYLWS